MIPTCTQLTETFIIKMFYSHSQLSVKRIPAHHIQQKIQSNCGKIENRIIWRAPPTGRGWYWALCRPWRWWPACRRSRRVRGWVVAGRRCRRLCGRCGRPWTRGSEAVRWKVLVQSERKAGRWRRRERCSPNRCGDTCSVKNMTRMQPLLPSFML